MRKALKNSSILALSQGIGLVIALAEIPVLARALGPESYGILLFLQASAATLATAVEYGFGLSGARQVAGTRGNRTHLARLVADITKAKALLAGAACLAMVVLVGTAPTSRELSASFIFWSLALLLGIGFSPFWYFLGRERITMATLVDVGARATSFILLISFVESPANLLTALIIVASAAVAGSSIQYIMMLRDSGWLKRSIPQAMERIREGFQVFLYRAPTNLSASISTPFLGALSTPDVVARFAPAEKLVRAATSMSQPVMQALLPHFSAHQRESTSHAAIICALTLSVSLVGCYVFMLWSEDLILLVLGDKFHGAVGMINILVWVLPLRFTSLAMIMTYTLPRGLDGAASRAVLLNLATLFAVASITVPASGATGMCKALILAEVSQFLYLIISTSRDYRQNG